VRVRGGDESKFGWEKSIALSKHRGDPRKTTILSGRKRFKDRTIGRRRQREMAPIWAVVFLAVILPVRSTADFDVIVVGLGPVGLHSYFPVFLFFFFFFF
jgi:hypothetical protein